jgi:hypothetical protein
MWEAPADRYAPLVHHQALGIPMKKLAVMIALSMLTLTACGSNADETKAKKSIAASMMKAADSGKSPIGQKEADCFAGKVVDKLGVEKLKKYKILNDKLEAAGGTVSDTKMTESDATATADAFASCVDIAKVFQAFFPAVGGNQAVLDCVKEALDQDALRAFLKAGFMQDEAATAKALQPAQECALKALPSDLPTATPSN